MRLLVVGDVQLGSRGEEAFSEVADHFRSADLRFCNVEGPTSDRGEPFPKPFLIRSRPSAIPALKAAGIDVVSLANNHIMDYGLEALTDTLGLLDEHGIKHAGAGMDLAEARTPAIMEADGVRVAFLAYCSFFISPYNAAVNRPGLAPVRVDPLYEAPNLNLEDVEALRQDVAQARQVADVVAVSHHWGISISHTLTAYQKALARETIDAGADMVLGGHPHILQGMQVYQGKPIFYGLGNFTQDMFIPHFTPETKEGMMVFFELGKGGVESVELVPTYAANEWDPSPVEPGTERWDTLTSRLEAMSAALDTRLERKEGRLLMPL